MVLMACVSFAEPVFTMAVYIVVQTNVAPNALRTSALLPQYMTKFAIDQVCDQPWLNVSIKV